MAFSLPSPSSDLKVPSIADLCCCFVSLFLLTLFQVSIISSQNETHIKNGFVFIVLISEAIKGPLFWRFCSILANTAQIFDKDSLL